MSDRRPCIVVAYDGSPPSQAALRCAADRAKPDGVVVVVYAYEALSDIRTPNHYRADLKEEKGYGRELLDALPGLGDVAVETVLVSGPAARLVANVASDRQADEIILGSRGVGRARALLGSVAYDVIHLATCPVTVIPERALAVPSES
jgi:nucleotide-binding universal stress UspA family protein